MTNTDFHARRTELSNTFAAAGAELLDYMRCAGALAAIPNTQQFVVAGDIAAIRAQLDTVAPQRRMRHGDRPEQPLYFGPEAGQARRWAALITSTGHGILQEYGTPFEHAQPGQEVLEVMEILPGAASANKAAEEGDRSAFEQWARRTHRRPGTSFNIAHNGTYVDNRIAAKWSAWKAAVAADRASRQVANKAEVDLPKGWREILNEELRVQEDHYGEVAAAASVDSRIYGGERDCTEGVILGVKYAINRLEELDAATPPATTGASTVLTDELYQWKWHDGAPPHPFDQEWFLAVTTYGDRVALIPLPEEYSYDYKTADGTYIMKASIKCWAQFPDSEYKEYAAKVAAQAGQVAVPEAAIWDAITRLERSDSTQQERFAAADGLRAIAAPSPAKESK